MKKVGAWAWSYCATALLVSCQAPDGSRTKPAPSGLSKEAAIRTAERLFETEFPGARPFFEMSVEAEPRGPRWVVLFKGTGPFAGPDSLQIILVDKTTGKAFLSTGH